MSDVEKSLLEKAKLNATPSMNIRYPVPRSHIVLALEEQTLELVWTALDPHLDTEIHELSGRQHLFSDERHFEVFDPFEHEDAIHKIVSEVLK